MWLFSLEREFDFAIFFLFFQCCLTWLLAYPALAIVSLVLPFHSRFKVTNMERLQWNNDCTKRNLRDWKNVLIVMEVNNEQNPVTVRHDKTGLIKILKKSIFFNSLIFFPLRPWVMGHERDTWYVYFRASFFTLQVTECLGEAIPGVNFVLV